MCKECGCESGEGGTKINGLPADGVKSPLIDDGAAGNERERHSGQGDGIPKGASSDENASCGAVHHNDEHNHDENAHSHQGDRSKVHSHSHAHSHKEEHHHSGEHQTHTIQINQSILEKNDRIAERNRGYFLGKGIFAINMLSSPGSGKTTLIYETAKLLLNKIKIAVIVGDLATQNDAERLRKASIPVVQINTGTACHLDAEMVARALGQLSGAEIDLLIIENVGNLVCPALFDLGENERVVLLSTTEGEDKPLKYPPLFHTADVAIITKIDLAEAAGFDRDLALENLKKISHHAEILELSARTGKGMDRWCEYLVKRCKKLKP